MGNATVGNDANFESEVLRAETPVLVDFWAPWCPPCRKIGPVLDELALENASSAKVVKVNVDDNPKLAASYHIQSLPTLMVFKGGEVVEQFVKLESKERLQRAINDAKGVAHS